MSNTKRNGTIDFMRFLFSILIIFAHCNLPSMYSTPEGIFSSPVLGVEFFFIVSGFLMAKVKPTDMPTGKATFRFIIRKYLSFLPVYVFAYVVSITASAIAKGWSFEKTFSNIGSSVNEWFMLQMSGLALFNERTEFIVGASWYLSAMLIAMAVLFPFLYAKRDIFLNVAAPLISICLFSYIYVKKGTLALTTTYGELPVYYGLLRAIAEISLGVFCFNICEKIRDVQVTKLTSFLLTAAELGCYIWVLAGCYSKPYGGWDFAVVLLLAIAVTISFSGKSFSPNIFKAPVFGFLGKFSLALYLNHYVWFRLLRDLNMELAFETEMLIYWGMAFITAFLCIFVTDTIKELWNSKKEHIRRIFIKENS